MLRDSFSYLAEADRPYRRLLIGTLLVIASPLIIPGVLLLGYAVQAVKNASEDKKLPEFESYKTMFIDGLKISAVFIVYLIGIIGLMFLTSVAGAINDTLGVLFFLMLVLIYFGFFYAMPGIVYLFSVNKSIKDGLRVSEVVRTVFSFRYLKVFLLLTAVYLVFSIVQILIAVTVIGLPLAVLTLFYEITIYCWLISEIR